MKSVHLTPRFWVAASITLLIVAFGFIGPLIFGGTPGEEVGGRYDPPSAQVWLGTDDIGQDIFTNLVYGTRTSLIIGLVAGLAATVFGTAIGLLAGYMGGAVENALTGITNVVLAIPAIVILILLSVALDSRSVVVMAIVIAVTGWTWTARAVTAQASSLRAREHLDVARLSGAGTPSILMVDVLPYLMSYVAMAFVLQIASSILAEAGLALLGLGPSNSVSLGVMLNWALVGESLRTGAWWAFMPPTLMLTLISFGLLMLQSSLDEIFNPRLRTAAAAARSSRTKGPIVAAPGVPTGGVVPGGVGSGGIGPGGAGPGGIGPDGVGPGGGAGTTDIVGSPRRGAGR